MHMFWYLNHVNKVKLLHVSFCLDGLLIVSTVHDVPGEGDLLKTGGLCYQSCQRKEWMGLDWGRRLCWKQENLFLHSKATDAMINRCNNVSPVSRYSPHTAEEPMFHLSFFWKSRFWGLFKVTDGKEAKVNIFSCTSEVVWEFRTALHDVCGHWDAWVGRLQQREHLHIYLPWNTPAKSKQEASLPVKTHIFMIYLLKRIYDCSTTQNALDRLNRQDNPASPSLLILVQVTH